VRIDDINDADNAETRIKDMQDQLQAVSEVYTATAQRNADIS
jgi:hypothetical protein